MSRWTWMECLIWVGAIAAISSISRPQSDVLVSRQSNSGVSQFPSWVASPECEDQKPLGFGLINIQQKSASESACDSSRRRNQKYPKDSSQYLSLTVQSIR
ncbi:hypothetical protein ACL6C3_06240 [Capilliphycus salinus ALCB114379]|uniref:hypothetical protein n=1 Tax=Capilliphycus salinus TaxID=2768948 RepID=UPI0039A761E2